MDLRDTDKSACLIICEISLFVTAANRGKPFWLFAFARSEELEVAWVSGVSGEKGKDGSEKGRELKERNFLSLLPLPPPPSKISSHLAP